jgi:asparagine synthase (glutamine-hydrolysing)
MCGITTIFSYAQSAAAVNPEEVVAIRDQMTARGPDDAGLWLSNDRRVGMGHRRLSIIDLSAAGHQPMHTTDNQLHIVFNGEIYNYRALKKALENTGVQFQSQSDTEVLLHLYRQHGPAMLDHLRGMFAFVIWDEKNKTLFAARDPFGIKPLYFADDGKTIRIASQVKALLKSPHVSQKPQAAGHVGFFLWGHIPEPFTLYTDIQSLPSGSYLIVSSSGIKTQEQYFQLKPEFLKNTAALRFKDFQEQQEYLGDALKDTVSHHLVSDVPVGIFQSAGLDSAILTGTASALQISQINTLTLGFEEYRGSLHDETVWASKISKIYGTQHQNIFYNRNDFSANLPNLLASMDQPSIDGLNTYFVAQAAKHAGLKVALSGLGGDEWCGGYDSFHDIPRILKATALTKMIPGLGKLIRTLSSPLLPQQVSPKYAGLWEYGHEIAGAYLLRRALFMPWEIEKILGPQITEAGLKQLQTLPELRNSLSADMNQHAAITNLEIDWFMKNQLLRDSDWAGMAHGIEIRTPFVDINFFRKILPLINQTPSLNKKQLAAGLPQPLPQEFLDRPKTGFSVPLREWLLQQSPQLQPERRLRPWAKMLYKSFTA